MKMKSILSMATILMILLSVAQVNAQDGNSILQKIDEVMFSPKDMSATNKIILIDKNQKQETREAKVIQKGTDKRLFRFTSPASQAGIAFLSLPNDVMYLYMPAFGKEHRISTSVKNQNFAGTDFSYDDLEAKAFASKYTPKLLKTEGNTFVLELTPKTKGEYSKVIATVNKTEYYVHKTEFYDNGNKKIKEAIYTFKKIGKYWNPAKIIMTDLKKNHKTKMIMENVKYDTGLKDDDFTVRKLLQ
jgi:outer membrane lipoprotein-sorting protein